MASIIMGLIDAPPNATFPLGIEAFSRDDDMLVPS